MKEIVFTKYNSNYGGEKYLFKIRINGGFVYMDADVSLLDNSDVGDSDKAVIVDSSNFLELWRNDPYHNEKKLAYGNEKVWRKDYKFQHAEDCFLSGITNPVPLAYVHCSSVEEGDSFGYRIRNMLFKSKIKPKQKAYCSFTDGITRTVWLLANGAKCFPVMTDAMSYELLKQHAEFIDSENYIKEAID